MGNFNLETTLQQLISLGKDESYKWESLCDPNTLEFVLVAWKDAPLVVAAGASDPLAVSDPSEQPDPESHQIRIPFNQREAVLNGLEQSLEKLSGEFIFLIYRTLRKEVNDIVDLQELQKIINDYVASGTIGVLLFKDVNMMRDTFTFFTKDTDTVMKRISVDWRS